MITKRMLTTGSLTLASLLVLALPAVAEEVTTITFDGVPPGVQCGDVWQESGLDVSFVTTTTEDCDGGGNCSFGVEAGFVWLYPSRLVVELGGTLAVSQVEVDWIDYCGASCTQAFVYDGGSTVASAGNTTTGSLETATLVPAGGQADQIAVSSCEGQIHEIRITTDVVATDAGTWSTVKALYR